MKNVNIDKVISQVFLEKSLLDFYKTEETCKGWETNVVHQPEAVKNIVKVGADRISAGLGVGENISDLGLARMIDHTILKADATVDEIKNLCEEARRYHFVSVCVNPGFVPLCADLLRGTDVKVCTVIGFPLGATSTESKRFEAEDAISKGAREIDMVINIGRLKSKDNQYVANDVRQVVLAAKREGVVSKVILETALLTDEEKIIACLICKEAGADFVKTSTGFSKGGATVGDVALMRFVVGSSVGVKASGGIKTKEDAQAMIASGADRIGASASVKIIS
ncbi:MAG TPA: deoxyribose-phosphate aldolase [Ignavibacteriaceae bacterium]|nr:deoxyribose-phosphate aldolase [Ignavibacteriaceae bacterium]HPO55947.1 deoxyribose-phosphate aldolase [Ignavibacteriaceae bacterium]